jgi:RNA polymerase primary sigma factor
MDLVQDGSIGLMRAVERFEAGRGKFGPYAALWIRQSISRSIADVGKTIRIPVHVQESVRKLAKKKHELHAELGRTPTISEISADTGFSPAKIATLERLRSYTRYGRDNVARLPRMEHDGRVDQNLTPEGSVAQRQLGLLIERSIRELEPRQARVLMLRFGFSGGREHTLEEVGEMYGVTRERIRQIEAKALTKLSHPALAGRLRSAFVAHFKSNGS